MRIGLACLAICVGAAVWAFHAREVVEGEPKPPPAPLGSRLADWTLPSSADGKPWSLAKDGRDAKAVVVLFLCTQCPVNNQYMPTLAELHQKYSSKGILFIGVNSCGQDDLAAVAQHAKEYKLPFLVLKDDGARLADRFAAARTPEAFVLDGTRTVRYRGRIDDHYAKGVQRPQAVQHDLADALDALLAGKEIAHPATEATGCPISRPPQPTREPATTPITYARQISRIIQTHCQDCHRPGEAAPFPLLTYEDAAAWSAAIRENVEERRMPPWHADPAHGVFRNSRRLADADRDALLAWVDQGCPEGDRAELPPPRSFLKGWSIGKPDEVYTMPEAFTVPAQAPKGGVPYQFMLVSEPFAEEKWVQAVECRPGAAGVVHHLTAFLVPPGTDVSRWKDLSTIDKLLISYGDDRFLGGYGPGENALIMPPDQAKHIPKGARIGFELHYTPNGTAVADRSYVGLIYGKEKPKHQVLSGAVMQLMLMIPANAAEHKVTAAQRFDRPAVLLSMSPHLHLRGKSFEFNLVRPDGSREVLLSTPHFDFNWQTNYFLKEPIHIPKGGKLECIAVFDNSAANPNNPNPNEYVFWGEQSWQEMMNGFFDYYWEDDK
jgi:thiol-disulfide isomerase/thioredoxin/mono/diheme cytochrome c family protein